MELLLANALAKRKAIYSCPSAITGYSSDGAFSSDKFAGCGVAPACTII